jgi:hypothetical protein
VHLLDAVHVLKLAGYTTTPATGDLRVGTFRAVNRCCGGCGRVRLWFSAWQRDGDVRALAYCPECWTTVPIAPSWTADQL